MSGHNKWAQIKHKKAIADSKRGKIFGKLSRAISIAARNDPDPATNMRLKAEIDRAKAQNMPNDNIERAISRVSDKGVADLSEMTLEIIGPGNIGVLATAITDNSNRTMNEVRQLIAKHSGRMAGQGSVVWMFSRVGVIRIHSPRDSEKIQLLAMDKEAEDIRTENDNLIIITKPDSLYIMRNAVSALTDEIEDSFEFLPNTVIPVTDENKNKLEDLLGALDDHDDIQDTYTNAKY